MLGPPSGDIFDLTQALHDHLKWAFDSGHTQALTISTRFYSMSISTFEDLLMAAREQPEPQRLLFVFASAELPDGSSPEQAAAFEAGHGGALVPLMCASKMPEEIGSFAALVGESLQFGATWAVVFAASLPGRSGKAPTAEDAEDHLQNMVESIKSGQLGKLIPFDPQGQTVNLNGD